MQFSSHLFLSPYPSFSLYTTWSLLSKKEPPSWDLFNDSWCARFKRCLPSTLALRLVLTGIYFQEVCKNKFKITWEGLKKEEAEIIQALTLKTLRSTLAFTAEERLKHEYYDSWMLLCLADLRSGTITLTLFWSDPIYMKAAGNILTNSAAQPCFCRWIYVHITPHTSALFKLDLKSKWHHVLKQWKYISASVIWLLKTSWNLCLSSLLLLCLGTDVFSSILLWLLRSRTWSAPFELEHCSFFQLPFSKNLDRQII